ncbi:hypothetical protein [Flavobacterium pectinovorum]|uniref:Uncharacterized protein n=1 Tax=Flavobacterium pectinovorum TaxID=29533 RepID=A0A502EFX5_9FLAO|nr:hypothetical protein [Flavobacterium pectinovorum]TPG35400.1 hypothetical protein EAH81_21825 [Flavobacterium pectinovorum]
MYKIISDLPIDYKFSTKTKDELKTYNAWFNDNKSKRIVFLIDLVKSTKGFESWNPNFSSESLKELGLWLVQNVEIEKISVEEYNKKRNEVPSHIDIKEWDLTIKTRSILVDIGIYFGEVFIKEYPNLKWEQYFSKRKKDLNHGHVIIKLKILELNPIWLLYIIGMGIIDKSKDENCLYDLFTIWKKYL